MLEMLEAKGGGLRDGNPESDPSLPSSRLPQPSPHPSLCLKHGNPKERKKKKEREREKKKKKTICFRSVRLREVDRRSGVHPLPANAAGAVPREGIPAPPPARTAPPRPLRRAVPRREPISRGAAAAAASSSSPLAEGRVKPEPARSMGERS